MAVSGDWGFPLAITMGNVYLTNAKGEKVPLVTSN